MPKVTDELSEPYGRTISTMIPPCLVSKAEQDPAWPSINTGWLPVPNYPALAVYYEDSIDLSGYALQSMTFFPELGFLQESPLRAITGLSAMGTLDATIISSIPLDIEYTAIQLNLAAGPGMLDYPEGLSTNPTPTQWETIPFCRVRYDALDTSLVSQSLTRPVEINQIGSLEPTAADKLYIYRIVIPLSNVADDTTFTSLTIPAQRVGFKGMMAEEPQLEYMMRLKRSYELANQV